MARYIKANGKVAEYLRLENDRNKVTDGNYLLWQADMLAFGRLTELPQILEQIGGLALQAHEAREEQDGTVVRKLPIATDPRFVVEEATEQPGNADTSADVPETDTDTEAGEEPAPEQEPEPESPEDGQDENQPVTEEPGEVTDPEPTPTDGQATASEETETADPVPEATEEADQPEADTAMTREKQKRPLKKITEA